MKITLDTPMKLSRLLSEVPKANLPEEDPTIFAVVTDSREAGPGDLFFALCGSRENGADYVGEALAKGALAVTNRTFPGAVLVSDPERALLAAAKQYRTTLTSCRAAIAVTGSAGKSTTKEFLSSLLADTFVVHATKGNENNRIGVSYTLLSAPAATQILICELGMNARGEIAPLSEAVRPDLAVITSVGCAHIGNLGSRTLIAKEKADVTAGMHGGTVLVPAEEPLLDEIPGRKTFSVSTEDADYRLEKIEEQPGKTTLRLRTENGKSRPFTVRLFGDANLSCLAAAVAAALEVGVPENKIPDLAEKIPPEKTRQRLLRTSDICFLDDSYNASPEAVLSALSLFRYYGNRPKSALLGDMLELGGETERLHRKIGRAAAKAGIRNLYTFGVYGRFLAEGAEEGGLSSSHVFCNFDVCAPAVTAKQIFDHRTPGELILCKGAHALALSRVFDEMPALTHAPVSALSALPDIGAKGSEKF